MAVYTIDCLGPWPVGDRGRDPVLGEAFYTERDGAAARPVLATVPHASFVGLVGDLRRQHEMTPSQADERARYAFRWIAAKEAQRWALSGNLRHRVDDQFLEVPVELDLPSVRARAASTDLPLLEPDGPAVEAFEVDD